jgi:hypothetical protein
VVDGTQRAGTDALLALSASPKSAPSRVGLQGTGLPSQEGQRLEIEKGPRLLEVFFLSLPTTPPPDTRQNTSFFLTRRNLLSFITMADDAQVRSSRCLHVALPHLFGSPLPSRMLHDAHNAPSRDTADFNV